MDGSPFLTENLTILTSQVNSNALIPCLVRNSGDGVTVSIYILYNANIYITKLCVRIQS